MIHRIYLAGPDVFLPNANLIGRRKTALCAAYGFKGLFPLDTEKPLPEVPSPETGLEIYRANVALMRSADAIIANMTPFRGASADVGTTFELGFFAALERPIFAYSAEEQNFADRTRSLFDLSATAKHDANGWTIEDFELPDNLMLPGAVLDWGGAWVIAPDAPTTDLAAMPAFEKCLRELASRERHPSSKFSK